MGGPEVLTRDGTPVSITSDGQSICSVVYSEKFNVIFVGTSDQQIRIVDPTLGDVLYSTGELKPDEIVDGSSPSALPAKVNFSWNFDIGPERVIIVHGNKIGIRSEYNGILFLNTILQSPTKDNMDLVEIELMRSEAECLLQSLSALDTSDSEITAVEKQLKELVNTDTDSSILSVKKEKWNTVTLNLPYSTLKTTFSMMVHDMCKNQMYIPQLSIASSILERLNELYVVEKSDTEPPLDKTLMFSEQARLRTYKNWPHTDYKWALPEKMAQAGFYHNPSAQGEDRAMCFTCNVCLVNWEPTDEPWSEHERHSPVCPFVRGEHTHNVPLTISYATAPAFELTNSGPLNLDRPFFARSSVTSGAAVAFPKGLVVVLDIAKQAKVAVEFVVNAKDLLQDSQIIHDSFSDLHLKPKEAWVMDWPDYFKSFALEPGCSSSTDDKVSLSCVALIGEPTSVTVGRNKSIGPSVVVAGTVTSKSKDRTFIITYGLSSNTISPVREEVIEGEAYEGNPTSGTKVDSQQPFSDDDFFGSYTSENLHDMSNDILSDIDIMTDDFFMDGLGKLPTSKKKKGESGNSHEKKEDKNKTVEAQPIPTVVIAQKLELPPFLDENAKVKSLLPTFEGSRVISIIEASQNNESSSVCGAIIVYDVDIVENLVLLSGDGYLVKRIENREEMPVNCCLIPPESGVVGSMYMACPLQNGGVDIYNLTDLTIVHKILPPGDETKITALSYCPLSERLFCGTNKGQLETYLLFENSDSELSSEKLGSSSTEMITKGRKYPSGFDDQRLIVNQELSINHLKKLLLLTQFENIKPFFTANVPSCWIKIIQAQKDRKHPQHLQHQENDVIPSTLSWRLQKSKNSKKEHLVELTLPKANTVGHVDVKFTLQASCAALPSIEVTLYRAKSKSRAPSSEVDRGIDFGSQLNNRAASNEFLQSIGAEPICGPLDLSSHLDLSGHCCNLVLTSPLLILRKGRNFYLHIRAKSDGKNGESTPTTASQKPKSESSNQSSKPKSGFTPFSKMKFTKELKDDGLIDPFHPYSLNPTLAKMKADPLEKRKDLVGCDWIHEVSITIRQVKTNVLDFEKYERERLLTSRNVWIKLLNIASLENNGTTFEDQLAALDLLVWIAAVILCGPNNGKDNDLQMKFVKTVGMKLSALILHGILLANRSTAHKCAKLIVLCVDNMDTFRDKESKEPFLQSVLTTLLELLPYTLSCDSAGALQWFFLLLNRVRYENLNVTSESLLSLLRDVSAELKERTNLLHALLRTRFGLYGTPFESELFELELPPVTKSFSHPLTYAGVMGGDNPHNAIASGTSQLWGLKDVDFRDLLVGNPSSIRGGKIGALSPKQQIQGLLEVEPLHFTCHAASDGTKMEKIDLGVSSSFAAMPLAQSIEPFTNLPTGEGSKKSEPDKFDQIMMLHKAFKTSKDVYHDAFPDLKFMNSYLSTMPPTGFHPPPSALNNSSGGEITLQPHHHNSITMMSQNSGKLYQMIVPHHHHHSYSSTSSGAGPSSKASSAFLTTSSSHNLHHAGPEKNSYTKVFGTSSANTKGTTTSSAAMDTSEVQHTPSTAVGIPSTTGSNHSALWNASEYSNIMGSNSKTTGDSGSSNNNVDGLKLLLSPWQQMMYVPPQQAFVVERMHSGARRFVVLDFGAPILLTDMVIPSCYELASLSIDIWLHREERDGQRLVVASDIGTRSLVVCDLQPPPVCRYLKIITIGRYGMSTTKCRIPLGMFYGHTAILPGDIRGVNLTLATDVPTLSEGNIKTHLSVLSYLVEDIGCRYQLACNKLKRLLDPYTKADLSAIDHISYYIPKGKERNRLGLNSIADQAVLSSYQECITLQQQLNVAKNVVKRLEKSLTPVPLKNVSCNIGVQLKAICTDKAHILSEFLIESLLGISFLASMSAPIASPIPYSLYASMNQETCVALFRNICVQENGQCQLSTCTLLLRTCGFQPWWGKFLSSTLKNLFSSSCTDLFPEDRVFILLVYLGQKSLQNGQNSSVLESCMELLSEILSAVEDNSFLRSQLDMKLLGWVLMYICLCLDGVNCSSTSDPCNPSQKKRDKTTCTSSRWDFIQGESALYRKVVGTQKHSSPGGMKRRIHKKILATKQKLEELDNVATSLGLSINPKLGLGSQLSVLGDKLDALKSKHSGFGKSLKQQSSKHFKDLMQIRRSEFFQRKGQNGGGRDAREHCMARSDIEINLNLNRNLCLSVAKGLGQFLLRMDATCHSDVYLIACKALARISTACRPSIPLSSILDSEQCSRLILTAAGNDFLRQKTWSSPWIYHAIMCLFQDILEGERAAKLSRGSSNDDDVIIPQSSTPIDITMNVSDASVSTGAVGLEDVSVDDLDSAMDTSTAADSEDSDYEAFKEIMFGADGDQCEMMGKKLPKMKRISPSCGASLSSALDARLENGVESTTELRLRVMAVVDSEVLSQSLKAPLEVPSEISKTMNATQEPNNADERIQVPGPTSCELLSNCFDKMFQMLTSENSSVNLEKLLQIWVGLNSDAGGSEDPLTVKPIVPLSCDSVSSLMKALTKNTGIGIQDWGLGFQCLSLAANQKTLSSPSGQWMYILSDKYFKEMILRFITGHGLNIHKTGIVSVGPTVCQHFYNFLLRMRHLSNDTSWTSCLKEMLLQVLDEFLAGPIVNADFPVDAFNKFLDRVTCPDLSYENPSTVLSIFEHFAEVLNLFVFHSYKIVIRSNNDVKNNAPIHADTKLGKTQNFEHIMFRLISFMASFVNLPIKTDLLTDPEVQEFLTQLPTPQRYQKYDELLAKCFANYLDSVPATLGDLFLKMETSMNILLSVLANPNGINVLVGDDLTSAFNIIDNTSPTTVVDAVIHLVGKLCDSASSSKSMVQPIFKFLSKSNLGNFRCPLVVSETFVVMVLKVIRKEEQLQEFLNMGCVESLSLKLIESTRLFFSSYPTFVSILTQYMARSDTNQIFGQKKANNDGVDLPEGLINVAPQGSIAAMNYSAHPSDVLLQSTPPHRRARSPVWSYHFFADESYLELIITLPCAVLLKEVQIVPHIASLSTSPSAVMVEIARDRGLTHPMGPPVQCSSITCINVQFMQPEVAQTVLLRLYKPKDSTTLGLSQIRLMSCTTFSEAAFQALCPLEKMKSAESSAHWLYILERAIAVGEGDRQLYQKVLETAISIPLMLESCYSLLVAPRNGTKALQVFLPHISSILLRFGSVNEEISSQLMQALLYPVQQALSHGMLANSSRDMGMGPCQLNTTIELVYKLCCDATLCGVKNLTAITVWLESKADEVLANKAMMSVSNNGIVPEYIQALAAAVWTLAERKSVDLSPIVTTKLTKKLLEWSCQLDSKSELKAALDHTICSFCSFNSAFFPYVLTSLGVFQCLEPIDLTVADNLDLLKQWIEDGTLSNRIQLSPLKNLESLSNGTLLTIGRVAQSKTAASMLLQSELLSHLNSYILDFWSHYTNRWVSGDGGAGPSSSKDIISAKFLVQILTFYEELCRVREFKTWFGIYGNEFWLPLLNLFSSIPGTMKTTFFGTSQHDLESVLISFLAKCCWSHIENQRILATCLREIILKQKAMPHKAVFLHSMSSFCRRMLIQLLLENEKIVVHVKNATKYCLKMPTSSITLRDKHPSMGVCGGDRIFYAGNQSLLHDVMSSMEPFGIKVEKLVSVSDGAFQDPTVKHQNQGLIDAGLEMIDQMQLAMSGNAAKDKRIPSDLKRPIKGSNKKLKSEDKDSKSNLTPCKIPALTLESAEFPEETLYFSMSLGTVINGLNKKRPDRFLEVVELVAKAEMIDDWPTPNVSPSQSSESANKESVKPEPSGSPSKSESPPQKAKDEPPSTVSNIFNVPPIPCTIDVFSHMGGLGLLAKHLPVVYPETLRQVSVGSKFTGTVGLVTLDKDSPHAGMTEQDWVKIESVDEFYDDMMESMVATSTPTVNKNSNVIKQLYASSGVPPHSMAAFGLFLCLPRFSEVLLSERIGAQCLLRLVMGVTDDANGNDIFGSSVAKTLPILPFQVIRRLLDALPLTLEEGRQLRQVMMDIKATHFILACLAVFTHQNCDPDLLPGIQHELVIAATKAQGGYGESKPGKSDDKSHVYWAKGTGFGTGSTAQSWDVEMAMQKKKYEEENVTCLLNVLSSYINPRGHSEENAKKSEEEDTSSKENEGPPKTPAVEENLLPPDFAHIIQLSKLFPAIAGYLRNDSVLDMARHVPLYRAVLEFLRSLACNSQLLPLLLPSNSQSTSSDDQPISLLLDKMKDVVDNYAKRLTTNSKGGKLGKKASSKVLEDLEDEGLALLIPDIQTTAGIVHGAVSELLAQQVSDDVEMQDSTALLLPVVKKSLEERYLEEMNKLQFAFYDMIMEDEESGGLRFTVPYHYENNVRTNWSRSYPMRLKRLAQESVTLSTSLPIAYGSTIFVRCDNDRLDVMKVLITGPAGTPYSNGCFEFDVFFPNEYPNAPMLVNLQTTGRQRIRFNPNLYMDGKVCLSILNTWHGRPEEKWNPQTSSLLPVLVAIQSLILNAEPYFNEPGYEKSRGTEAGERSCREYNAGIQIATVEWAMLDQIRHPSPCFRDVIQRHFWLKRSEVIAQCEEWYENLVVTCKTDKRAGKSVTGGADPVAIFKNNLALLKKELGNLKTPKGLEDLVDENSKGEAAEDSGESSSPVSGPPSESQSSTTTAPLNSGKLNSSAKSGGSSVDPEDEQMIVDS